MAGVALHLLPVSLFATSAPKPTIDALTESGLVTSRLAHAIQGRLIGTIEQMAIMHIYAPESTPRSVLVSRVQQDFALAAQLTGLSIQTANLDLFTDSSSTAFGSYTASLTIGSTAVTWQGMAIIGGGAPEPAGILRLFGSAGTLQMSTTETRCQILDLSGKQLSIEGNPSITL